MAMTREHGVFGFVNSCFEISKTKKKKRREKEKKKVTAADNHNPSEQQRSDPRQKKKTGIRTKKKNAQYFSSRYNQVSRTRLVKRREREKRTP